jgi:hypothetical protein
MNGWTRLDAGSCWLCRSKCKSTPSPAGDLFGCEINQTPEGDERGLAVTVSPPTVHNAPQKLKDWG